MTIRPSKPVTVAVSLLFAAIASAAHAQSPGIDLGAIKPKTTDSTTATKVTTPIGVSPLKKPTEATTPGSPGATTPGGIGTSIRNPLAKGVLGAGTAGKSSSAQEESANSNDVVVKMPSNMKK